MTKRLILLTFLTLAYPVIGEETVTLTVNVTGASPGEGQVLFSLFTSEKDYLRNAAREATRPVDLNGNAQIVVDDAPVGRIAVTVVYDKNENGKMDTNLLRIPKEKIGFSNDARGSFGPAKFDKASFRLDETMAIEINLVSAIDR